MEILTHWPHYKLKCDGGSDWPVLHNQHKVTQAPGMSACISMIKVAYV